MKEFLKKVPFFANLPDEDLETLCQMLERVELKEGEELFAEGSKGDRAYIIENGELEIIKASGSRNVLLAVRGRGDVIGEMSLVDNSPRMASVRAHTDVSLITIHHEQLTHLLSTSNTAAEAMFYTVLARWRNTESKLRQSEKMATLGTMTAGIAHELNNPSAAVKRGAEQLELAMTELTMTYVALSKADLTDEQRYSIQRLAIHCQSQAGAPPEMDALARSDKEYELEEWLDDNGVEDAWELAPSLAEMDYSDEDLALLVEDFESDQMGLIIRWLVATYHTYNLFAELRQGAERISGIVKALKTYSYLDQAPVQEVDIHRGLDDTLLILNHKLKSGPTVKREYDEDLPSIYGYGSELNQVWTNLIDNAADALAEKPAGEGVITLRTSHDDNWIVVEVEDNGPGIPPEVKGRIFDPFFTTKPPGEGTGLGLDISYNIVVSKHRGEIKVDSEPGRTTFKVWLPINFEEATVTPLRGYENEVKYDQVPTPASES
ncbi:MAG: sensor histidine kinase [Candidatus Promineifilaceae bacterium]|jgi:signal transduction histidine kinase